MKALFNNNLIDTPLPVMPDNRAFQFGDGIFETIWFRNGKVPLLEQHRERIRRTAQLLRLDISNVDIRFLDENIETLRDLNLPDKKDVVAKLMFWRHASDRPGYWADQTSTDSLLVVRPFSPQEKLLKISLCEETRIAQYPWSTSKNLNALPYVMASMECRDKGMDELVLLNQKNEVAEGISSNIFIYTGSAWKTPWLSSGCVAGTMRAYMLQHAPDWNIEIREEKLTLKDIRQAGSILMTRATGLGIAESFMGEKMDIKASEHLRATVLNSLQ